ncbi:D-alanyl-D-alanine carboxypeptidase family protein [Sporosarcina sp. USHLN248]|uniref:D-alanyl-D-alanine carboxypeptidase family protein n=1 Tax=Sporosarcina sp. USHLN248 TaxID=3081300 RepID=UPI0030179AE6
MFKKSVAVLLIASVAVLFIIRDKDARKEADPIIAEARAAFVMEAETGKILYESNSGNAYPIASMSKLMTQYLVLKAIKDGEISWDSEYRPSENAMNQSKYAVTLGMDPQQTYTVRELFEAMTVVSANDAAIALSEVVSGSEKAFVKRMNEQAKKFGLQNTHFVNSTGLDEEKTNMATARDVAAIARSLIEEYPEVIDYTRMTDVTTRDGVRLWSTNHMLPGMPDEMDGMDGLKTGYTEAAESCFASTGVFNGKRIITVVIGVEAEGGDTNTPRFALTRKLIDHYVLNQ